MNKPSAKQFETVRQVLAAEGGCVGSAEERAAAARRVYEQLLAQLAPLIGSEGVRALFARSVKLSVPEFSSLADATTPGESPELDGAVFSRLVKLDATAVSGAAMAVYAMFYSLLTVFIGEGLAAKQLSRAYPDIDESMSGEEK